MKIGILTLWWSEDNYGQLLQCYAMQKCLQDMGHYVYLIRYHPLNDYVKSSIRRKILKVFNPVSLYNYLLFKRRENLNRREKRNNPRGFGIFRNKYIEQSTKIYYSHKDLVENPPSADIYIVGSDQVWNMFGGQADKAVNVINVYFLNFGGSAIKRISYAASFGREKNELDNNFINMITPLLKKFDYVSVREKSGLEICKQCDIDNVELVPDPTMLLHKKIYRALYESDVNIKKPTSSYCFLYLVGNEFDFSLQSIYDWAKGKHIEVIYVTGNSQQDKYKKTYATIPEWIYLLDHAEYVISNSYHCAVFSLLFMKKFAAIPLVGNDKGMNSRFDTLFHQFNIEKKFLSYDFSILDKDIDRQSVSDTFKNIRDTCQLSEIISGKTECP